MASTPFTSPPLWATSMWAFVEQIGDDVSTIKVGDFVIGSFFASDNTCEICRAGYQSRCVHAEFVGAGGAQSEILRVPWPTARSSPLPASPMPN